MSLANFGAFAIGAVMLLVGFMAVAATYPTVQDLQSTMGQVGRFVDPQIQQRYESAVSTMQLGGLLIVVGFIVLVIGSVAGGAQPTAVLREAPIGRQTPKMYVAGAELARDESTRSKQSLVETIKPTAAVRTATSQAKSQRVGLSGLSNPSHRRLINRLPIACASWTA